MNTFVNAVQNQETRTENGMKARVSTADASTDLFFKIGASRGQDIIPQFVSAFTNNIDDAMRIAQWSRDVRGGAGERKLFIDIVSYLEQTQNPDYAIALIKKIPELGRWKDLVEIKYTSVKVRNVAYDLIKQALNDGNGLCAKWMPRKGKVATDLRIYFDWTPKFYRKRLVELTKVVETQMCNKDWNDIEFSKVPSLAMARYRSAFYKNATTFEAYVEALVKGDPSVKVNAGAVYPYDVIKGVNSMIYNSELGNTTENNLIVEQWKALENFVGDTNILPMIDVSGSMNCPVGGSKSLTCLDVAVSLGLYCADKNTGKFQDTFLTFSESPQLLTVKGNIIEKVAQTVRSKWGMNTNLVKAFEQMLYVAQNGKVDQSEMPEMVIIFSDMQFDSCVRFDDSAIEMIKRKYANAGYEMPKVVFWNLRATDNVPVKFNENGVALVSGFSPSILKAIVSNDFEQFSPVSIMNQAIAIDRYDW